MRAITFATGTSVAGRLTLRAPRTIVVTQRPSVIASTSGVASPGGVAPRGLAATRFPFRGAAVVIASAVRALTWSAGTI
ncbi:hypothetical protein FVA74_04850 [Salinibacterium sp. dk2585]|uniref:hypothetical protein n=1 Tax=unclassified Salinibacterium TaxID=2632331 RepID=UPI0011C24E0F|nr:MULTISPECIES: hypothetical protein [unclassified Salinibacterium]QEE60979.1 hypothetical protein FVA74_04850 [Salinibacterium sp. dk2585]TXK52920.1 hypothetical protein FVP63_10970 [Salinibacterium sp. dk5596]